MFCRAFGVLMKMCLFCRAFGVLMKMCLFCRAFGVLMWEVVTLGQQPYPARTNIEVLHFVRAAGKLERPEKCTDEM